MTIVEPVAVAAIGRSFLGELPSRAEGEISHEELVDRVRQMRDRAHQAGQRLPGRPALASTIGTSAYRVRRALEEIARDDALVRVRGRQSTSDADPTLRGAGMAEQVAAAQSPAALAGAIPEPRRPVSEPAGGQSASDTEVQRGRLEDREPTGASDGQPPPEVGGRPWPLVIIGLAAAISVWSGWVGLGQLAGFGMIQPLPGVWDGLRLNSAIVLPISVEAYAAYALRCWLTSRPISSRARRFARWSAIISLVIGAAAQVAFHLMTAAGMNRAPWPVTVGVATVPVVVLGLATALASLIRTGGTTRSASTGTIVRRAAQEPSDTHLPCAATSSASRSEHVG